MIIAGMKKQYLFAIAVVAIVCFGLWQIIFRTSVTTAAIAEDHEKATHPSNKLCQAPDGSKFRRGHLRELSPATASNVSAYATESDALKWDPITRNYSNLSEFIHVIRAAFMSRKLLPNTRSIPRIFRDPPHKDMVLPSCDGLWMEFGVFQGQTLSHAARWKTKFCGNRSSPVFGFDTFSGLPTDWRPGFSKGAFNVNNKAVISVPNNAVLVQGLFIDSLPTRLLQFDREYGCHTPVSFVHIDCDIYDGARDVLFLLAHRLVPGSIIVFDELFNYPGYEKHEIKALFELLSGSNLRVTPLGAGDHIVPNPTADTNSQSFGLVVDIEEAHWKIARKRVMV